jgi:hypothetical protein
MRIVSDRRVRNGGGCSLATPFGVGGGFPAGGNGDGGGRDLLCWLLALLLLLLLSEDVSMLDVLLTSAPSPLPAPEEQDVTFSYCNMLIKIHIPMCCFPFTNRRCF